MLKLLRPASRVRKPETSRFAKLSLERLEDRLCPTEMIYLGVTYLPHREATFSVQLMSPSGPIANQQVNLNGVVTASGTTNSQGNYKVTLPVPQLGQETATSADGQSNTASYTLVGGNPVISNFSAVAEGHGLWCFSGTVSGAPAQGEVVNFTGIKAVNGQSVQVNSNGTFDFYATVTTGNGGWATARAVDWWGDQSAIASAFVNC